MAEPAHIMTRLLRPGLTFVSGRDGATARLLIETAERLGLPARVVRTVSDGYLVPDELWDTIANPAPAAPSASVTAPKKRRKPKTPAPTTPANPVTTEETTS